MRVRPVVKDVATVVHAVAESLCQPLCQPLSLDSVLDADVYRLRPTDDGPDLIARAFGADAEAATVTAAVRILTAHRST